MYIKKNLTSGKQVSKCTNDYFLFRIVNLHISTDTGKMLKLFAAIQIESEAYSLYKTQN